MQVPTEVLEKMENLKDTPNLIEGPRRDSSIVEPNAKKPFYMGGGKISQALGGLFSATAGPLLPHNIAFKPLNKMWKSPSHDSALQKLSGSSTIA